MMEVVAPTNMAEGFEFEVQVNGGTQKVTVVRTRGALVVVVVLVSV